MGLKHLQNTIALIYSKEKDDNEQVIKLLLKLGFLCKCESDVSLIDEHITSYQPTLVFAPNHAEMEELKSDTVTFITSKRRLYRELSFILFDLNSEQWRAFLRDAPMDYLTKFLWYICDADLLKATLEQLTLRTAQFVIEELEKNYSNKLYSEVSGEFLLDAEGVTAEMLTLCYTVKQISSEEL